MREKAPLTYIVRMFLLSLLCCFLLSTAAVTQQRKPARKPTPAPPAALTNADIIRLVEAKMSDEIILTMIQKSKTKFDLSTDGLVQLRKAGVSNRVIEAMMNPAASSAASSATVSATSSATPPPAKPAAAEVKNTPSVKEAPATTATAPPVHESLARVAEGKGFAVRTKAAPPLPRAMASAAPQNYGMYIEQGGQLKAIGRIQTKVQHSKWRALVATKVPFVRQKIDINIPGAHSDTRFEAKRPAFYAFFPPSRDVSKFKLVHCKITGQGFDQRTVANLSIMFSREQNQDEIPCDIGPTAVKDLYRLVPREDLPSGEFTFLEGNPGAQSSENVQIIDVWDFGIDLQDDKLGINEYLDTYSLISKGDVSFLNWSKDDAQKIVDAHAGRIDLRGKFQGPFKRQFADLGVYWVDENFARAFARLEMLDRNLTPEQAAKLAALLTDVDQNHYYVLVSVGQKIGSGRLIGANEAERTMRPYDSVLYNVKDDDFIVAAKKAEGLGGYAGIFKVTFERAGVKGQLLSASPEVYFEARLNQNLDFKARFTVEQITAKLAQVNR